MKFTLEMAGGACSAGLADARERFEPGREYGLKEMQAAGLCMESMVWILSKRAETHADALAVLSKWAATCARAQGVRRVKTQSPRQCGEAMVAAVKAWCKCNPGRTRKGGKAWAYSQLIELINAEGTGPHGTR